MITTKTWINKANIKHNNKYDYSKVVYKKATEKVIIICKEHGEFLQNAGNHLTGSGCPKCGKIKNSVNRKLSTEEFIQKAQKIHGNEFSYEKTIYNNNNEKVIIICKKHGEFLQTPGNHLTGHKCKKCSVDNTKTTIHDFIENSNTIHNHKYVYSKVNYINSETKVIIICEKHGEFLQTPASHLMGSGCPNCKKITKEDFIDKANLLYNNKYDYSNINYETSKSFLNIICKEHGEFSQYVFNHLNGYGCPDCRKNIGIIKNENDFIGKSLKIHDNFYSYNDVVYYNSQSNVEITCPIHGNFQQQPNNHIQGKGCFKCSTKYNKNELEILEFIKSFGIINIEQNNRSILNGKELDIYLPDYKLAIEYNGLYWHSDEYKRDNYHNEKTNDCLQNGIQLIHIFEDEWIYKKDIVKSRIQYLLGKITNIAYGRNCFVREINTDVIKPFLINNHIQGFVGGSIYLGLYYKKDNIDYLLSVMSFGKLRRNLGNINTDDSYELLRFCNAKKYTVIGGANKLLKYFEKNYNPKYLISYADRRWSVGNIYNVLGFTKSHVSKPNYYYIDGLRRLNRFNYRKDILVSKYNCKHEDTERNFTKNILNLNRIYDSGNIMFFKQY